jgi:tRNA(Ile2) C34 agmatinyltransferase TiaS
MPLYRVRMREQVIVEYLIRAETEAHAREWMARGLRSEDRQEIETPDAEVEAVHLVSEDVGRVMTLTGLCPQCGDAGPDGERCSDCGTAAYTTQRVHPGAGLRDA